MPDKRNHIIRAATRLFGLYGYHSVGIDWVIAEAHVTKTTMYRHFPLKTDLIVEVLQQRARACAASLDDALAQEDVPLERIRLGTGPRDAAGRRHAVRPDRGTNERGDRSVGRCARDGVGAGTPRGYASISVTPSCSSRNRVST